MTVDELRDRDAAVFFNLFYPPREAWDDAWRAARIAARQQHPVRRAWAARELGGHGSLGVLAYHALEARRTAPKE